MMRNHFFCLFILTAYFFLPAVALSNRLEDSLKNELRQVESDTVAMRLHLVLADYYRINGNYQAALDQVKRALFLAHTNFNETYAVLCWNRYGEIYLQQGNYVNAQKSFLEALTGARKLNDLNMEADILGQLGIIYWYENNIEKALEYFEKAYSICEKEGHFENMSGILNNLGLIYRKKGDYEKAKEYYNQSAALCIKLDLKQGLANVWNNIGIIYQYESDYENAMEYYQRSLKIREEQDDKIGITTSLGNIGSLYLEMNNLGEAEKYLLRALEVSESVDDLEGIKELSSNLSELHRKKGDGFKALDYYKKFIAAKESLDNAEIRKQTDQQELVYRYEMEKVAQEAKQQKKDLENEAERKKQNLVLYVTFLGLLAAGVFSVILYKRFRVTRRQKRIIEEKNKEITDSINYAKRIQAAILTGEEEIKKNFPQSFLLYLPKDIIAGDFYFFEKANDYVFYAAADCTGHGVPGALVSVVCSNALTRCVKEFGLTDPGEILDKTRELVIDAFSKGTAGLSNRNATYTEASEDKISFAEASEIKDGMDISLCCFKFDVLSFMLNASEPKTTNLKPETFKWAGANNPIWIYSSDKKQLVKIKGDKQPVGKSETIKPFTTHGIELGKNDVVFMFTDGFADQFGGPGGKKFKYSGLENLLAEVAEEDISVMKEKIKNKFYSWKGAFEQTDDVCIIGIRM